MKILKLIFVTFFLLSVKVSLSQNLVLNPSFEDTISLNQFDIHYNLCQNWVNPSASTSDYFTPYCQELGWGNGYCSPQTFIGDQEAYDGVAYMGLVLWEPDNHPTKDYAQGFLSQPLNAGEKYYVSMYINLANSSDYKTCEIEIAFTDSLSYSNILGPFNFTDTVKFNLSNADTVSWLFLTSTYIAIGGEQYIYIGSNTPNFELVSCIDTLPVDDVNYQSAYYFIDNIYVSDTPLSVKNLSKPQITVFPNPANDFLYLNKISKKSNYSIINNSGLYIARGVLFEGNNVIGVSDILNGIYFLELNQEYYKIIINH